jgi:hypothetical protein
MIALPQFRGMSRGGRDPLTNAYASASGATDLAGIDALIKYVRAQGLLSNFRLYPMKSAQNAGSGSTVYGIGNATTEVGTLVNGPTWGAGGISYTGASSHYMSIPDFLTDETITVFGRVSQASASPAGNETFYGQYDTGVNERSFWLHHRGADAGKPYRMNRSSDGTVDTTESATSAGSLGSTDDRTLVAQWINGGGRALWFNKSEVSLTVAVAQTSRNNATVNMTFAASLNSGSPTNFGSLTGHALAVLKSVTPTTTQRETLTDLINAL